MTAEGNDLRWRRKRHYRSIMGRAHLVSFRIRLKETDLHCQAVRSMEPEVRNWIMESRMAIEGYAATHPGFLEAKSPLPMDPTAPPIVREMLAAGAAAAVGPMAAVAGAIAQYVGRRLAEATGGEVIVENGGDCFIRCFEECVVTIWAGASPLSGRVGVRLGAAQEGLGVCTSSGTLGHSTSLGRADAVTVIAQDAALADAWATSIGNRVASSRDIPKALATMEEASGIVGGVVVVGKRMGAWGCLELVPLKTPRPS